ncbi:MAG: hypothetical protein FJW26_07420 [Acidimicrobiia bacterium]|nr:hypothetical protein [Acidimicrobiia bacterium]
MIRAVSRRRFLKELTGATALSISSTTVGFAGQADKPAQSGKLKIAAVYTTFTHRSHANVILENFLEPYYFNGERIDPRAKFEIVSMWGDQNLPGDFAGEVVRQYGVSRHETIADALCLGGATLAVDGVLSIGEGGRYYTNKLDQVMFPRKRFFDEIIEVMRKSKRVVPLFTDKHLAYRWDWAKAMYDTAARMKIPLMAGSSIPLTEHRRPLQLPVQARIEEALSVHGGHLETYDFHALELLQSIVEARRGGETGVSQVQFLQGAALWEAAQQGRWSPALADAAMEAELGAEAKSWRTMQPEPHAILIEYKDGFRASTLRIGDDSIRWNFACRLQGETKPRATRCYVGPWRNRYCFKAFCHAIQHHLMRRAAPWPVERTLLTTGILDAAMQSRYEGSKSLKTPQLEFSYRPVDFSAFRELGATWSVIDESVPEPIGTIAKATLRPDVR